MFDTADLYSTGPVFARKDQLSHTINGPPGPVLVPDQIFRDSPFLSASQAWCLGCFFPLIIGDLVPEDEKCENFLELLTIMDYVFAPVVTNDIASYLEVLIEDFLIEFRRLYSERHLTPKIHYHSIMDSKVCAA